MGQLITFTATVTGNAPTGTVQFMDGTRQVIPVERRLEPGQDVIVGLQGGLRSLRLLVVYSAPDAQSAYSIFGD